MKVKKVKIDELDLSRSTSSKYQLVFDELKSLKKGSKQAVVLPTPSDGDSKRGANKIGMALRSQKAPLPPEGYRWSVRRQRDGSIAIFLVEA